MLQNIYKTGRVNISVRQKAVIGNIKANEMNARKQANEDFKQQSETGKDFKIKPIS